MLAIMSSLCQLRMDNHFISTIIKQLRNADKNLKRQVNLTKQVLCSINYELSRVRAQTQP